nr:MAG TPA: hypothetical protein [Caudoviricetes sp.]
MCFATPVCVCRKLLNISARARVIGAVHFLRFTIHIKEID